MARSENQKLKLLYLRDYLCRYSDPNHPVTIAEMIEHLAKFDISAERKSLYSDIRTLQDYGMDIVLVKGQKSGYYVNSRDFELPELRLLVDAVQSSRFLTEKKSTALIRKLADLTSQYEAGALRQQVVVSGRVKTMDESIYYAVDAIQEAIANNSCISFDYTEWTLDKQRHKRGDTRTATPWALVWHEENYYLIAYTQEHGITHYRVDKMQHICSTGVKREIVPELKALDLAQYNKKVFSMYNGQTTKVKMRFHNSLAGVVLDRFGTDIMLIPDGPEHFLLTTDIATSPLFYAWIIGFGNRGKILWPENVAEECRALCREALAQYE